MPISVGQKVIALFPFLNKALKKNIRPALGSIMAPIFFRHHGIFKPHSFQWRRQGLQLLNINATQWCHKLSELLTWSQGLVCTKSRSFILIATAIPLHDLNNYQFFKWLDQTSFLFSKTEPARTKIHTCTCMYLLFFLYGRYTFIMLK